MRKIFRDKYFYGSVILSVLLTYLLDIIFVQSPLLTRREILLSAIIFLLSLILIYYLIHRFFIQLFRINPHKSALLIGSAILASITCYFFEGLVFDWRIIPTQSVVIEVLEKKNPASTGNWVKISNFESNFGILSFNELNQSAGWERAAKSLLENGENLGETLTWNGRPGAFIKFNFLTGSDGGSVQINSLQGKEQVDLYSKSPGETTWEHRYPIPPAAYLIPSIIIWVFSFFVFLFLSVLILPFTEPEKKTKPLYWLLFSLPMLGVWFFYLLTFWPGEMSPDSIVQWGQILSGQFTDTHPAIHTMLLWLLTRTWLSPAPIAVFQILLVSFSIAWGLKLLVELGINLPSAWLLAFIFAFSPINSTIVISIWKDIPYAVALFLFTIQVLKIIISNGSWLTKWPNTLAILFSGLCVMLFRHNGIPVPILSLVVLAIFYRPRMLRFGMIILGLLFSYILIRGPIYDLVGVSKEGGLENAQFIHHISAHVVTGGPLTEEEQNLADVLLPEKVWDYNCCRIDETDSVPGFTWSRLAENSVEVRSLFFKLLLKEPQININNVICASQIVWNIRGSCGMVVTRTISHNRQITENPYGLIPQSKIPEANKYLTEVYNTAFFIPKLQLYWYPAIYLIFIIAGSIMLSSWMKVKNGYLFCVPAVIQSVILALVSLNAADFRYQYGVYLLGMYSLGIMLISINTRFSVKPK